MEKVEGFSSIITVLDGFLPDVLRMEHVVTRPILMPFFIKNVVKKHQSSTLKLITSRNKTFINFESLINLRVYPTEQKNKRYLELHECE
jgi:hypothetical protein